MIMTQTVCIGNFDLECKPFKMEIMLFQNHRFFPSFPLLYLACLIFQMNLITHTYLELKGYFQEEVKKISCNFVD